MLDGSGLWEVMAVVVLAALTMISVTVTEVLPPPAPAQLAFWNGVNVTLNVPTVGGAVSENDSVNVSLLLWSGVSAQSVVAVGSLNVHLVLDQSLLPPVPAVVTVIEAVIGSLTTTVLSVTLPAVAVRLSVNVICALR